MKNKFTKLQLKWIKALESGDYLRCTGQLVKHGKKADRFCCLGVACDVLGLQVDGQNAFGEPYYWFGRTKGDGAMPGASRKLLNIRDQSVLADMNDNGASFKQIAKALRTRPWEFFTNFTAPK